MPRALRVFGLTAVALGIAVALAVLLLLRGRSAPVALPAARVEQGEVFRTSAGPNAPPVGLRPVLEAWLGDVVETRDGAAVLALGGARLVVPAHTRLEIDVGTAVVRRLEGLIRAEGGASGVLLSVDTPTGIARIRAEPNAIVELTVGEATRVAVSVGAAVVERSGRTQRAGAGQTVELSVGAPEVETPRDKPPKPRARVSGQGMARMRSGEGAWTPVPKESVEVDFPVIVEARGGRARVEAGSVGLALAGPADALSVPAPGEGAALVAATARGVVTIDAPDGMGAAIDAGDLKVEVTAVGETASARVLGRKGQATVDALQGAVDARAGGHKVELVAGERAQFIGPKAGWKRFAAPAPTLVVKSGEDATVLHAEGRPSVGVAWPGASRATVQVAGDPGFGAGLKDHGGRSGAARIPCDVKRTWWRLADRPGVGGSLACRPASKTPPPRNEVFDTGEKTVVYYQKRVPELILKFDASATAVVSIYSSDDLSRPLRKETVEGGALRVLPGEIAPGRYVWYRTDKDGRKPSRVNELEIRPETEVAPLEVVSATSGAGGKVVVRVRGPAGGVVQMNGVAASSEGALYQAEVSLAQEPLVVRWTSGRRSLYLFARDWGPR